jgi:SAM-dependent methyltransferase
MPSSDPITISKVLSLVCGLAPKSILDIGVGNGRYGFLFRECLDLNYGRLSKSMWEVAINGVEVDFSYMNPIYDYAYGKVYIEDWMEFKSDKHYDLAFMGDVLEHFKDWQEALAKAKEVSSITIVVSPNWPGSTAQGAWCGHEHEDHKVALSPQMIGGRCVFANSKVFMCVFDNLASGIFDGKDFLL